MSITYTRQGDYTLAPDSAWKDGRRFAAGTSQATIEAWLKDMGY